ncbi:MAG: urease accessory protein UreD, partial [Beijerinckiaceae bacterium]
EKIYRSSGLDCQVEVTAQIEADARLAWLPQETILFSGARLNRCFHADLASNSTLLLAETVIFGRIAAGELPDHGLLHDRWRVRRQGRLVFAEDVRIDGHVMTRINRPAVLDGMRSTATILFVAPEAEAMGDRIRTATESSGPANGVSTWNGMLLARSADTDPARLRRWVATVTYGLLNRALPRVWQC